MSEQAVGKADDFIDNEKQFHLGFLPTEQSNPLTKTLEKDFPASRLRYQLRFERVYRSRCGASGD